MGVGEEILLSELKTKTPSGESLTFSVNVIKESDPGRDDPAACGGGGSEEEEGGSSSVRGGGGGLTAGSFTSSILQYLVLSSA